MINAYTTTATLTNKRTLILDEPLSRVPKRVRVTIEDYDALPIAVTGTGFLDKLQNIHQELVATGYQSRRKEVIDSDIRAERDSWEN